MRTISALPAALAVAALGIVAAAGAKAPHVPAPKADPAGIIDLPPGFQYRVLARGGQGQVVSTESGKTFPMPDDFDANAAFAAPRGGTWLLSSHELTQPRPGDFRGDAGKSAVPEQATSEDGDSEGWGSVSRLRLNAAGEVTKAELITTGLHNLCAGAKTPRNTFLVNEEFPFRTDPERRSGWIWEIDPATGKATKLAAMGRLSHEQEVPVGNAWYETEDLGGWRFLYRFVPDSPSDLTKGTLFGLKFDRASGTGTWIGPLDPTNAHDDMVSRGLDPTVSGFDKAEGMAVTPDRTSFVFSESGSTSKPNAADNPGNVWLLTPQPDGSIKGRVLLAGTFDALSHPDNLRYTPAGDLVVAEDNGSHIKDANGGYNELRLLPKGMTGTANTVVLARIRGEGEPTGPWFYRDGKTMYLSLQDVNDKSYLLAVKWSRPFSKAYAPALKRKG